MFSPHGGDVVSGSGDETVRLWDIETGRCIALFPSDAPRSPLSPSVAATDRRGAQGWIHLLLPTGSVTLWIYADSLLRSTNLRQYDEEAGQLQKRRLDYRFSAL